MMASVMTLQEAIRALRAEVCQGLDGGVPLADGLRIQGERVTMTLSVALTEAVPGNEAAAGSRFVVLHGVPAPHSVTIEFSLKSPGATGDNVPHEALPVTVVTEPSVSLEEQLFAALSGVFGVPGFDSSARASVFREALAELSPEHARELLSSLGQTPPSDESSDIGRARHLITRLAGIVSTEPASALKTLASLSGKFPVDGIVALVARQWKTQHDWIGK
jgi:hypothetical protein